MYRKQDYNNKARKNGGGFGDEYLDHITKIEKMPSIVGVKRYPNLHHLITKTKAKECVDGNNLSSNEDQDPNIQKKVQFAEKNNDITTQQVDKNGMRYKWANFKAN
ncbi:hypothetical protein M9H77_24458 [Catharanthus roseus]|uniref:Uncharacterized protein n=1 Tax=Catharanthus roseus TaxID=4058 RepID=A0ACC0AXW7_CATRO|nr:hypothetical protein M9H77_24458 [Catharanthus roseus]